MKKIISSVAIVSYAIFAVIACTPDTTSNTPEANQPEQSTPSNKAKVKVDDHSESIAKGEGVFMKHCYQCHAQPPACSHSAKEWSAISAHMADKAGLDKKEEKLIRNYLISRTKP